MKAIKLIIKIYLFGIAIGVFLIFNIAHGANTNTCTKGNAYIILNSSEKGHVCLDDTYMYNLQYTITDYKLRLSNGGDINTILQELRDAMKNSDQYNPEMGKFYAIVLDRIKEFSLLECKKEKQGAKIEIPNGELYSGFNLTPVCLYPKTKSQTTQIFTNISVSWKNEFGNEFTYQGTNGTFSGLTLNIIGNGKHTVTCKYRANYCTDWNTLKKEIYTNKKDRITENQHSIARAWNELTLNAIRKDTVRPPIQARNLFHVSAAMYDAWTLYNPGNESYLFGGKNRIKSCQIPKKGIGSLDKNSINETISYAAYGIISERYKESPGYQDTKNEIDKFMNSYGFSVYDTGTSIKNNAKQLGILISKCYLDYGKSDGSNEEGISYVGEVGSHANLYYNPINPPLNMNGSGGNPDIIDWNRWQPLSVGVFIDQAGNTIPGGAAKFIGAEWGNVKPFALQENQKTVHERDGQKYITYLDPGEPPKIISGEINENDINTKLYKWNFELVGLWSSHLDPRDKTMIDISPKTLGNITHLPSNFSDMVDFYDMKNGGTKSNGHEINPKTGMPYDTQIVARGDYTRTIAEFWADGPKSETPPGHWFSILNGVSDKIIEKKWRGKGKNIDNLEWDIKSYFTLGGAMHDAAIGAWGIKGAYDGIRPVSAIRAMATHGQSTDKSLTNYNPMGLELIPGYIETIGTGDILEGKNGINRGKIKIRAWKGPKYIYDTNTDFAGVDWILAENWWPYQRSSFVTPPFAGYVSGHSTFSRSAAEVLTAITGDEYFPGGLMRWPIKKYNYLVFEQGPNTDIELQWATYRDAANESALSRIWGGIHPPMDDITGRILGEKIGIQAVNFADSFFKK